MVTKKNEILLSIALVLGLLALLLWLLPKDCEVNKFDTKSIEKECMDLSIKLSCNSQDKKGGDNWRMCE